MTRILIVDDDLELALLLGELLESEGFDVTREPDGGAGLQAALADPPDLVVLDVMLPRLNGFDVLRGIRHRSSVPVIMLTARGEEVDRIVGLELGADDYLPKPFNPRELVARIRAVLRRGAGDASGEVQRLAVGDLELDPGARQAWRGGEAIELTGLEFTLLERLLRNAGSVVSREALFHDVLGRRPSSFDRSLDVHISSLRRKLGPAPEGGDRIRTVRGVGYQYLQQRRG